MKTIRCCVLGSVCLALCLGTLASHAAEWNYFVGADGGLTIGGKNGEKAMSPDPSGDVTIPAQIGGTNVTAIAEGAFKDCAGLTTLSIPATVVTMPLSTFDGCTGLSAITVAAANPSFATTSGLLYNRARTVLLRCPSGITTEQVAVPNGCQVISDGAFAGCAMPTNISISATVTNVGETAFIGCSNLTAFAIATANQAYSVQAGVLYDKAKTRLVSCPPKKAVWMSTIAQTVKEIAPLAFADYRGISYIRFPDSLETVGEEAFSGATVAELAFGTGLRTLSGNAFVSMPNFIHLFFYGNAPTISGTLDFGSCPSNLTIIVTRGSTGWTASKPTSQAIPQLWPEGAADSRRITFFGADQQFLSLKSQTPTAGGVTYVPGGKYTQFKVEIVNTNNYEVNYQWFLNGSELLQEGTKNSIYYRPPVPTDVNRQFQLDCYITTPVSKYSVTARWICLMTQEATLGEKGTYKTFEEAAYGACCGDTVTVDAGCYEPGSICVEGGTFVSKEGYQKTGLVSPVVDAPGGRVLDGDEGTFFEGFSITNGTFRYVTLRNCVLTGEASRFENCNLYGCIVTGIRVDGVAIRRCCLKNCTVTDNACTCGGEWAETCLADEQTTAYNTIFWNNVKAIDPRTKLESCCTNDPRFANAAAGDFRPDFESPAIRTGNRQYYPGGADMDGKEPDQPDHPNIGALQSKAFLNACSAQPSLTVAEEGQSCRVKFMLSDPNKADLYAFLIPMNADASNKVSNSALTQGKITRRGQVSSEFSNVLTFNDGPAEPEFKVVMATQKTWDPSKVITEYRSATFTVEVKNVTPVIASPAENTNVTFTTIGNLSLSWRVTDVSADTKGMKVEFTGSDGSYGILKDKTSGTYKHLFKTAGNQTLTMKATDKDGAVAMRTWLYEVHPADYKTVTFDFGAHGRRTGGAPLTQIVDYAGDAATVPDFTVDSGWVFTGWAGGDPANVQASGTFVAQYRTLKADLHVDSLTVPSAAKSGDTVTIKWVVGNTGNPDFNSSMIEMVRLVSKADPTKVVTIWANSETVSVARDGTVERSMTWTVPAKHIAGEWYVVVETGMGTSSEYGGDNTRTAENTLVIEEQPLPDLSVKSIEGFPANVMPGDTVTVRFVVQNLGTGAAKAPWTDSLYLVKGSTRTLLGSVTASADLAAGASVERDVEVIIPELIAYSGAVTFFAKADSGDAVTEIADDDAAEDAAWLAASNSTLGRRIYLTASTDSVKENYTGVIRYTLRRSGEVNEALALTVSAEGATGSVSYSTTVTIPANYQATTFSIRPVNNSVVDGTRAVAFTFAPKTASIAPVQHVLTILDDEVPRLTLTLDKTTVREGGEKITATVTRELVTDEPLTVYLSGVVNTQCKYPASVVIPAGEASVTFEIEATDNATAEISANVTLKATATGYTAASAGYTVEDDDVPGVILTLTPEEVSEDGGARAVYATLTRTDTTKVTDAIRVRLTASVPGQLILQNEVTIQKYYLSAGFYIGVIDNAVVDGDRDIVIDGAVVIESCGCSGQPSSGDAIQAQLRIIDNDVPKLDLKAEPNTMKEGLEHAGDLVLSHNSTLLEDLTVNLSYDLDGEIEIPETVVIPAGETSVRIPVRTLDDGVTDGSQQVSVYADDPTGEFASGSWWVIVSDQNLPDLNVTEVVSDTPSVVAFGAFKAAFTVKNTGFTKREGGIPYAVYVAAADVTGVSGLTPVKRGVIADTLEPGAEIDVEVALTAPELPKNYRVIVQVDPDGTIVELDEANNATRSDPFAVSASYTATATVERDVYQMGEEVTISGQVTAYGSASNVGVPVEVYVIMNNGRTTIPATSDLYGRYTAVFKPTEGESGHYIVGACYPGSGVKVEMDAFDILGLRRTSGSAVAWNIALGDAETRSFQMQNLCGTQLTGLALEFADVPDCCQISYSMPKTLPAYGFITVYVTCKAVGLSAGTAWDVITCRAYSSEGAEQSFPLYFHSRAQNGQLVLSPTSISTTMTQGSSKTVDVLVYNNGKGDTGKVTVTLPNYRWLRLVGGANIANIPSGDSAVLTFELSPGADEALNFTYTGSIAINCANANGVTVPLSAKCVSDQFGSLKVFATDEFSSGNLGSTGVRNATVAVRNPYTDAVVATGNTGDRGWVLFENLPTGKYKVRATAERHESDEALVVVDAGIEQAYEAYLQYQAVTATWEMEKVETTDEYEIKLVLVYETNVPMPNVKPTFPDLSVYPDLAPGESMLFNVTLQNVGLATAKNFTLDFGDTSGGYSFTPMRNDFDILAGETVVLPVRMTHPGAQKEEQKNREQPVKVLMTGAKKAMLAAAEPEETIEIDGDYIRQCRTYPRTVYYAMCGPDGQWRRYAYEHEVRVKNCTTTHVGPTSTGPDCYHGYCGDIDFEKLVEVLNRLQQGYAYQGSPPGISLISKKCNQCHQTILEAIVEGCLLNAIARALGLGDAENARKVAKNVLDGLNDYLSGREIIGDIHDGNNLDAAIGAAKFAAALASEELGLVLDIGDCIAAFFNMCPKNWRDGDLMEWQGDRLVLVDKAKKTAAAPKAAMLLSAGTRPGCPLKSGITVDEGCVIYEYNTGNDEIDALMTNLAAARRWMLCMKDIIIEITGDEKWCTCDPEELKAFLDAALSAVTVDADLTVADVKDKLPEGMSDEDLAQFVTRLNKSVLRWLCKTADSDGVIDLNNLYARATMIDMASDHFESQGYDDIYEGVRASTLRMQDVLMSKQDDVCATIKFQLSQRATMTRHVFDGTLTLFNGNTSKPIKDAKLRVIVRNEEGVTREEFFDITLQSTTQFKEGALDGTTAFLGELGPGAEGTCVIRFNPTIDAAPEKPTVYYFSAELTYFDPFNDEEVKRTMTPIAMTVNPAPLLAFDYFVQRDVYADDPDTPDVVEASLPAELAVLISNSGYGDASNLVISTVQPKIVENEKGVPISFSVTDYTLKDSAINGTHTTLAIQDVALGTVPAQGTSWAQWWLTSTIQGHFVGMEASYTHLTGNGNERLSYIRSTTAHELIKSIADDDGMTGFMTSETDVHDLPDMVFWTNGGTAEVSSECIASAGTIPSGAEVTLNLSVTPSQVGWTYARVQVDRAFDYTIKAIRRDDGTEVPLANAWITDRVFVDSAEPELVEHIHLADKFDQVAERRYSVVLQAKPTDVPAVEEFEGFSEDVREYTLRDTVKVVFTKPIDPATFTTGDLRLRFVNAYVPDLSGLTIAPADETGRAFVIGNLSSICNEFGLYELTVLCNGISDLTGTVGTDGRSARWTFLPPESLSVYSFSADGIVTCRNPLDEVVITFSDKVDPATLSLEAISLNGQKLAAPVTCAATDESNTRFSVKGLAALQTADGAYTFAVDTHTIRSASGVGGVQEQSVAWSLDTTPPVFERLTRETVVGDEKFVLGFSEPVVHESTVGMTVKINDIVVPFGTAVNGGEVTITIAEALCRADGTYTLSVTPATVTDAVGNVCPGAARTVTWTVDNTPPEKATEIRISPDTGAAADDGITTVREVTISGKASEADAKIEIFVRSLSGVKTVLATPTVGAGRAFSADIVLPSVGNLTLIIAQTDNAGNTSETEYPVFVDAMSLTATLSGVPEAGEPARTLLVTFTDEVNADTALSAGVELTFEGDVVATPNVRVTQKSATQFEISGLESYTTRWGTYVLTYRATAVEKALSGLKAERDATIEWKNVQVDRTPPYIASLSFGGEDCQEDYLEMFSRISVRFSEPVNVPELVANGLIGEALKIRMYSEDGEVVGSVNAADVAWDAASNTLSWEFDPDLIPVGKAEFAVEAALISDMSGNRLASGGFPTAGGLAAYAPDGFEYARVTGYAMPTWYDYDKDGLVDLVVGEKTGAGQGKVKVFRNVGTAEAPVFSDAGYVRRGESDLAFPASGCQGLHVSFGDVDGDGRDEMIVGLSDGKVYMWRHGRNRKSTGEPYEPVLWRTGTEVGFASQRAVTCCRDLDGDGIDEIVLGGMDGKIRWMKWNKEAEACDFGWFTGADGAVLTVAAGRSSPSFADINADGIDDIVSGDTSGNVWAFLGNAQGGYASMPISLFANSELSDRSRTWAADVDADGDIEIIVGRTDGSVTIMQPSPSSSPVISFSRIPVLSLAEALGADFYWDESSNVWRKVQKGREASAQATVETEDGTVVLRTTLTGAGVLRFKWAAVGENASSVYTCAIDGEIRKTANGPFALAEESLEISGAGSHTVVWTLSGRNTAVIEDVRFAAADPSSQFTSTTEVPVPYSVIRTKAPNIWAGKGGDYEAAAKAKGANGLTVWESYVAGLDPENENSKLRTQIEIVNGKPVITWEPDLGGDERIYTTYGKEKLEDADWQPVTDANREKMHFFKVGVEMR